MSYSTVPCHTIPWSLVYTLLCTRALFTAAAHVSNYNRRCCAAHGMICPPQAYLTCATSPTNRLCGGVASPANRLCTGGSAELVGMTRAAVYSMRNHAHSLITTDLRLIIPPLPGPRVAISSLPLAYLPNHVQFSSAHDDISPLEQAKPRSRMIDARQCNTNHLVESINICPMESPGSKRACSTRGSERACLTGVPGSERACLTGVPGSEKGCSTGVPGSEKGCSTDARWWLGVK